MVNRATLRIPGRGLEQELWGQTFLSSSSNSKASSCVTLGKCLSLPLLKGPQLSIALP